MTATTLGLGALVLRPRQGVADAVDPSSPGLWGVAATGSGLVGLRSSGSAVEVVRLTDRGPLAVDRVLGRVELAVAAGIAAGAAPSVLGAAAEVQRRSGIQVDHLPEPLRTVLATEVDGPLSVLGRAAGALHTFAPVARTAGGGALDLALPVGHGVLSAVLGTGGGAWLAVQHPPTGEGDHCSHLTVARGAGPVLEVADLGLAGPASLVGPSGAPLVSVADGEGRLRTWRLGPGADELPSPGQADEVAVHVADGRPVGLRTSPAGLTLVALAGAGWEAVHDVEGTADARRVVAVAGPEAAFLVDLPDRLALVDGGGRVLR